MTTIMLDYDRAIVRQETYYNCGPASAQIVLNGLGIRVDESALGREIGTHTGGTDYIGLVSRVLRARSGLDYRDSTMPNDPPTDEQRGHLWRMVTETIAAGRGLVVNWVAPPSNYPRAVAPSTIQPAYSGGVVYHYVAIMGYSDEGARRVWVADPGFYPYGYWLSFAQLATLVPPKGYTAAPGAPVHVPDPPARRSLDAVALADVMGRAVTLGRYEQLVGTYADAMVAADINTVERAAMWAAQLGHESVGLRHFEEIASGAAYEGRSDLGNVQRGDGVRFKGRGPIQVTGRGNYTELSRWAHARGLAPSSTYFVDRPTELSTDRYGFVGVVWYWTTRGINTYADRRDLDGATRRINGGLNGLADRRTRYMRALDMGDALLPSDKGFLMALTEAQQHELYEAVCGRRKSLVEGSTFEASLPEYVQLIDAATYRAEQRLTSGGCNGVCACGGEPVAVPTNDGEGT